MIARTYYRRGIIEERGSGMLKMAEITNSAGLPVPEIEDDGGAVTVRFRHARLGSGVSERQVRTTLEELRDSGLVTSTARGPLARWVRDGARWCAIGARYGVR